MEYYPDTWAKHGRMLAPLLRRECGRMSFWQTAPDNVNGPSRRWYRLIQTSWSPYDIYTTSTKRLGVVITQDNWPIAFVVDSLRRAIINTITELELLAKWVQRNVVGTQIYIYTNHISKRRSGGHPTEYSTLENTLTGICPRDHLYVRIHNTVAYATKINNPKVDSSIGYNHACMRSPWKRRRARDGRCTQKFGRATKASTYMT